LEFFDKTSADYITKALQAKSKSISLFEVAETYDQHTVTAISLCELMTLSPNGNVLSLRSTDKKFELFATKKMKKMQEIHTD
jgi:hypothetical protein